MDSTTALAWGTLVITPAATIFGIWLTNRSNFRNLTAQHEKEQRKAQAEREYTLREGIYQGIILEMTKAQQLLAAGIEGKFPIDEFQTSSKELGRVVASALVIAKPETIRLLQAYMFLCLEKITAEIFEQHETVRIEALAKRSLQSQEAQRAVQERLLVNIDRTTGSIATLLSGSTDVLLAIREELSIDTDPQNYKSAIRDNAADGKRVLLAQADKLRKFIESGKRPL